MVKSNGGHSPPYGRDGLFQHSNRTRGQQVKYAIPIGLLACVWACGVSRVTAAESPVAVQMKSAPTFTNLPPGAVKPEG